MGLEPMDRQHPGDPQQRRVETDLLVFVEMDTSPMGTQNEVKRTLMPMRSDERLAQRIATHILPRYPVGSVLDIGCGDGVVSHHLPRETDYLGLDINEACIYEQKHDNPKVRYVQANAIPVLMAEKGPWDMVLLFDVLEHTRDFTQLFELALKSCNQYVIVSLPNELFFMDRARMLLGQELNAHSLDLLGQPEGFKHQYIINIAKARTVLSNKANNFGYQLREEVVRPLKPKNKLLAPLPKLLAKLTDEQLWSQGSIFIFQKQRSNQFK